MRRKIQVGVLFFSALVVAVFLLLDMASFINGSLEMFPTDEQQEKIKVMTAGLGISAAFVEALVFLLWRQFRRHQAEHTSSPAADDCSAGRGSG